MCARPRNGRIAPARGADAYTSAETPNHMETTRIRAPKLLITRNRRPSPARVPEHTRFSRKNIKVYPYPARARRPRAAHSRAPRHDVCPRHLLRGRSRERAGAIQAQRLRAVRLERRATRREVARRGTPRRRDARWRAMGPPMRYAHTSARANARRAGARDATRVGTGEIRRRDAREGGSRGVATEIFSSSTSRRRRRRRDVDASAMLTRMTRIPSSRSREDEREGSTTSRRREKIRTAED